MNRGNPAAVRVVFPGMSDNETRTPANRRAARIVTATVVAGGIALAGGTAYANANSADVEPVRAASTAPAVEAPPAGFIDEPVDPDQASREVFFDAGYTYDDAVVLGKQWAQDSWEAKVTGGEKLAAGETLPIEPGSSAPAPTVPVSELPTEESTAVDAFFAAGYTYDDAVALGGIWHVSPWEAKVTGGRDLLAGETLPVAP
ncbi:hypothetical protein FHR75_001957 [Kineococcus radiotolerans]|uniref:Uncharacterized protein n=1 Tax=Kineococcus radiotolerans TaxID=131568 RepID=A0A7W4TLL2_KINRA|nr:hypothetical protein [Kineococcus radiotolerans]MBB2901169.1 hypothetical protein [Kineococcus radiotolerans]